jgi:hypothetical protein
VLQDMNQRRLEEERRQLEGHVNRRRWVLFQLLSKISREMEGGFASKETKLSAFVLCLRLRGLMRSPPHTTPVPKSVVQPPTCSFVFLLFVLIFEVCQHTIFLIYLFTTYQTKCLHSTERARDRGINLPLYGS